MDQHKRVVRRLLKVAGTTYATGADVRIGDKPMPLSHFDKRAARTAKALGLPGDPEKLGALAPRANARLAAALVRASLDDDVRRRVAG